MFQFPGFASLRTSDDGLAPAGLPHSAISGSPRVCRSPELFAAYHGLHRLRVPRHPPHAFARLTTNNSSSRARAILRVYDHVSERFSSDTIPSTSNLSRVLIHFATSIKTPLLKSRSLHLV